MVEGEEILGAEVDSCFLNRNLLSELGRKSVSDREVLDSQEGEVSKILGLLVEVVVSRHPIFQRQGYNIFSSAPISFAQAALGGDVLIDTVDGKVAYTVKPGTQTDTKIRLKGKGVPSLQNKDVRGDQYVTLVVQVPTGLTSSSKDLLKKFDELTGDSLHEAERRTGGEKETKKKKGFFG